MCGIFGYIGHKKKSQEIVLHGLKTLEYRGYDSWGIAARIESRSNNKKLNIEKHVGKIGNPKLNYKFLIHNSHAAIGHTRWATHGGVTTENAHPHLDCKQEIAIIHNGIVENNADLKKNLVKKGHRFISQTDTEVIVHLIEEYMKKDSFLNATNRAFKKLKGLNAIVVLHAKTKEIIAAKNGSPLIVGRGNKEFYIASDATGIIPYTQNLLFLKDNEMVVLDTTLSLFSLSNNKKLKPRFELIDWQVEKVDKGTFSHFMIKEIYDQPKVTRNIAQNYSDQARLISDAIQKAKGTFFIAAGTAYHASLSGAYLFSRMAQKQVNATVASEFNYLLNFIHKKSLVIALSQSGETIDVIEPLTIADKKGATIAAITNTLGSSIYRMADIKLLLGAGPEKAVASTKAYAAKIALLLLISYTMAHKEKKAQELLLKAADEIEKMLDKKWVKNIEKLSERLLSSEHIYTVGRGLSYGSALEAALKIKEVSYIHTEGLAGGELKHGTIALITKSTPCIVFAPSDETYEAMISNATEIKARGGMIIGISPSDNPIFDHWIEVADLGEASLLTQIIPAQLLAYYLAVKKGYDPDKPRNLAKSVTVK